MVVFCEVEVNFQPSDNERKEDVDFSFVEFIGSDGFIHSHSQVLPATSIISSVFSNSKRVLEKDKVLFCYQAVLKTISSCLEGRYSDFDGHTTSNCCHGMALLARNLINLVLQSDLLILRSEGERKIKELESCPQQDLPCSWWIPRPLVNLAAIYILGFVKENDPIKGGRTVTKKLKEIAPISTSACYQITQHLQKKFSNWIANAYHLYGKDIDEEMCVSGAALGMWRQYVAPQYVRTDKRGVQYVSNLFSMQVSFAHLIKAKAKVALVNDVLDSTGNLKGRFVCLFEGDGAEQMRVLPRDEIKLLNMFHKNEPVVVLGGCAYTDHRDRDSIALGMEPWLDKLPSLLLACDVFYPQFLRVTDDPEFNSSPIVPTEETLQNIIDANLSVAGVSATDPSLYCAAHIYPASLRQVLKVWTGEDEMALPVSFIPGVKLVSVC